MHKKPKESPSKWTRIQKLRQSYLNAEGFLPDYWSDQELLLAYDETLAQRIRWKWRSVFLKLPPTSLPKTLVDLGCGSGAASRELLSLAPNRFEKVVLIDRSAKAMQFAASKIREEFPSVAVVTGKSPELKDEPYFLLVSHIFSELPEEALKDLMPIIADAEALLWVESGRHQESRRLISLRESLRAKFRILAPCPHQVICGMLIEGQEENWCHFKAEVPKEVHHSAYWREASKQLNIDLRSLPVAYLFAVAQSSTRAVEAEKEKNVTILAGSRTFKGFVRYHACHESKVFQADYMKRNDKALFEALSDPSVGLRLSLRDLGKEE